MWRRKMKPIFAVVDDEARTKFEKEWQVPYGYSMCRIFQNQKEAMINCSKFNKTRRKKELPQSFCVEKLSDGFSEIIFKGEDV